jgi:sporulation protein YlmC with PRC-barrel domain
MATKLKLWRVSRIVGSKGQYIGTVQAVDAEAAEKAAIKELGVKPEDQNRIMVREQE